MCRDIARAISNSNGAGGSTVGALEFVDAGSSTIEDTVAANWTLAAGQSIPTGAFVDQDLEFNFQQTHANGSTKTVAVRIYNRDTTGNSKAENGSGYNSVVIRPVLDFGESYESTPMTPAITASASTTLAPGVGVSAKDAETTVHVIARDKVIAVIGDRWGYKPGRSFEAVLEAPVQYENIIGRNKPSQTYFYATEMFTASFGTPGLSVKVYCVDYTTTNPTAASYGQPLAYFMMDTLHEKLTNKEVRMVGVQKKSWNNALASPSNADPGTQMTFCAPTRDITQADGWGATWNYDTAGDFNSESLIFSGGSSSWAYHQHAYSFDPISVMYTTLLQNQYPTDPAGNPAVQLSPVVFRTGNQGGVYDFSSECGLYVATNNVPRGISVLNDGADDYVALRVFDNSNRDGCVVLKV